MLRRTEQETEVAPLAQELAPDLHDNRLQAERNMRATGIAFVSRLENAPREGA
jgi:hypothetical protein